MFTSPTLASRIDRAEGRLCAGIARAIRACSPNSRSGVFEIAGGVAVFAGPGSPTNKMIGIGFDGPVDESELERVERVFAGREAPLQAEVATLADPGLPALLVGRGYRPAGFENVLGHDLRTLEAPSVPGVSIERASPETLAALTDVIVQGFACPDDQGVGGDAIPPAEELRHWFQLTMSVPGFEGYLARLGDALVGGGSLRLDGGIAQLAGAATLPAFRRRGVQTALLRWRLAHARASGCDVAIVTTQPASKSQQNVQREGFQLLYARQLLVKQP
jgi:GNAT superfamily N-acetyltransferase